HVSKSVPGSVVLSEPFYVLLRLTIKADHTIEVERILRRVRFLAVVEPKLKSQLAVPHGPGTEPFTLSIRSGIHHLEEIKEAGLEQPAVNQIEIHPWCQQRGIVDYCKKNGILLEAYSPLTRGRYLDNEVLVKIAEDHKKEQAQVLVRWALQMGYVPLPKSSQPTRIISNADVFDFELSKDEMDALYALDLGSDGATTWHPVTAP
ncbi:hypothetical protein FRB90_000420, partial [Tulasnella sp. 427]